MNPKDVTNWTNRGYIYRGLVGTVNGVDEFAITSYEEAAKLEPVNPAIYTELGKVYLIRADLLAQQQGKELEKADNLANALKNFDKAVELKSDYAPAHFQIAMVYIRQGKMQDAITKLEATKLVAAPRDTGLAFQLGLLYYNNSQWDKAKAEFTNAITWNPNYSNARYFLGLILDRQGDKAGAISQFQEIAKLNPDNQELPKIIANLQAGKPALQGIGAAAGKGTIPEAPIPDQTGTEK